MININSVGAALYLLVASNAAAVNSNFHVDLDEPLNTDPNKWPWVGITPPRVTVEPYHANVNNPWRAQYEADVYVQDGSGNGAAKALDNVRRALDIVLDALNGDRTLLGSVTRIVSWDISPFDLDLATEDAVATYQVKLLAERINV